MIRFLLPFILMASAVANAANTRFVEPGGQTSFNISRNEVNRIAVVDDRITSFVKIKGSFNQTNDPVSGDLFITPLETTDKEPVISGFITTEKGNTIQLFLVLKSMPSTNTELQTKQVGADSSLASKWERSFDDQRLATQKLAKAVENHETLPGFTTEQYEKGVILRAKGLGQLTAKIHGLTLGFNFLAEDMTITNPTKEKQPLTERYLNDQFVMGVYMVGAASKPKTDSDVFYLNPGESIRAIRIRQNTIQ